MPKPAITKATVLSETLDSLFIDCNCMLSTGHVDIDPDLNVYSQVPLLQRAFDACNYHIKTAKIIVDEGHVKTVEGQIRKSVRKDTINSRTTDSIFEQFFNSLNITTSSCFINPTMAYAITTNNWQHVRAYID